MTLYALQTPGGTLIPETVATSKHDAWYKAFDWFNDHGCGNLHGRHHDRMAQEDCPASKSAFFTRRFWKRPVPMVRYAKLHGYSVVQVHLVLS